MLIVETTGEFSLLSPEGVDVRRKRPTVMVRCNFVEQQAANGQLRVLCEVSDEASDKSFEQSSWALREG